MKYILWDLISPYDGYQETEFETWDEAEAAFKARLDQYSKNLLPGKADLLFAKWKSGEMTKIDNRSFFEIFITTVPLNKAIS